MPLTDAIPEARHPGRIPFVHDLSADYTPGDIAVAVRIVANTSQHKGLRNGGKRSSGLPRSARSPRTTVRERLTVLVLDHRWAVATTKDRKTAQRIPAAGPCLNGSARLTYLRLLNFRDSYYTRS